MGIEVFRKFDRGRRIGLQLAGAILVDPKHTFRSWYIKDPSRPEPVLNIEITPPRETFAFQIGTGTLDCPAGNISQGQLEVNFVPGTLRNEPGASSRSELQRRFMLLLPDSFIGFSYKMWDGKIATLAELYQAENENDAQPTLEKLFRSEFSVGDIDEVHSLRLGWTNCRLDLTTWDNSDIMDKTLDLFACD